MTDETARDVLDLSVRADWVRLRTLVLLRWIAVAGQTGAVLVAAEGLGFRLPMPECAAAISAAVMVNLGTTIVHPAEKRLSERGTLLSLLFDLVQLVALLMLTGGLNNPFAVLMLAPVTISATALRLGSTIILGLAAVAVIPLMATVHLPLIRADGSALVVPELYRHGFSAALAIGVVFLAGYARRVTLEGHRMSEALGATQLALAREQQLAAIGSIAAATAHELGTPLATIKLTAGELARELKDDADLAEDAALIRREAERCGEIMADLSRSRREDAQVKRAPISAVIEEAAAPHANRGKEMILRIDGMPAAEAGDAQPTIARSPELIHGLRNIIQNAVDFARTTVWIDVEVEDGALHVSVGDDGPGFGADLLPRLGEPYVTTRARGQAGAREAGAYQGMGLGLFIARTLLERTGATLTFANGRERPSGRGGETPPSSVAQPPGAIIEIAWREPARIGMDDRLNTSG